jgi:glutamate-1-semialdehyde 2,1-aminomutase
MDGLEKVLADKGVESRIVGLPSMFSIFIGEGVLNEYRDASRHNEDLYESITMKMIDKGVMPCPDAREPWFVCAAHTEEDVATSLQVFEDSLGEALS